MTGKKILIIDDSETVRRQVKDVLGPAGFVVIEARDGVEGIERCVEGEVALIICDVNMPRLDGIEMLARLKASGSTVPAVMLTTEVSTALIQRARSQGAKSWIVKPFRAELLRAAVERLTTGPAERT